MAWTPAGNLKGPKGDTGDPGPKGDPGDKGDQGDPGTPYTGPVIYVQATDPGASAPEGSLWVW